MWKIPENTGKNKTKKKKSKHKLDSLFDAGKLKNLSNAGTNPRLVHANMLGKSSDL